jgi:hypothetical protein
VISFPVEIDYREAGALPLSPVKAQIVAENRHASEKCLRQRLSPLPVVLLEIT